MAYGKPTFSMLVKCIYKEKDWPKQVKEEEAIKKEIAKLLHKLGYVYVIFDEDILK